MAIIKRGNWAFRDPGADIAEGSIIEGGNFSQHSPDTAIMVGKTLTITGGNFCNVRQDAAWTINGGMWVQITRCANLSPYLVAFGLPAEAEACAHSEVIEIVGGTDVYEYKDEVL